MATIPKALTKLYQHEPSNEEARLLGSVLNVHGSPSQILEQVLITYRDRGKVVSIMQHLDHVVTRPMQLGVAFAIPTEEAIEAIRSLKMPVVEMGAGSGYWAALLQNAGIQIEAYDLDPSAKNEFFETSFFEGMRTGSCEDLFNSKTVLAKSSALLLVWPNDPDPVDNRQFCANNGCMGSQPTWDMPCLEAFVAAGGARLIYVGERESSIREIFPASVDCGLSSTRRFQHALGGRFVMTKRISVPNMWLNQDDLTIWTIRKAAPGGAGET